MSGMLITVTDAGRAALVAKGNTGTEARKITSIGLAKAAFNHKDKALKKIPGELKRITTFGADQVAPGTLHVTLKDDTRDQFRLYGFGLYLDNGVLFAAYSQAQPIMEKSAAAILLLSADLLLTSVDTGKLVFGPTTFLNPPASETRMGVVELATQAETDAGTDDVRAVTPKAAARRYAAKTGARFSGNVHIDAKFSVASPDIHGAIHCTTGATHLSSSGHLVIDPAADSGRFIVRSSKKPTLVAMPSGKVLIGKDKDNGMGVLQIEGIATAHTPPANDKSQRVATTEFVARAILSAAIGQIVMEPRTKARAGFLVLNGAVLQRKDYPALWAYAESSGALVHERDWMMSLSGCFSNGDGSSTFRIPELRGEFLRCLDYGRGVDRNRKVGRLQEGANQSHSHEASASISGAHVHHAWTDDRGQHAHSGNTHPAGEHQHVVPWGENFETPHPPWGIWHEGGAQRIGSGKADADNVWYLTSPSGNHQHHFVTTESGTHNHPIAMHANGNHQHKIAISKSGVNEARPRNIAMLTMIRAY